MTHEQRLKSYQDMVDEAMHKYIPNIPVQQYKLIEAMHYSLFAGGKRLRPVLLLEFCRVTGGDVVKALPFACALEMIHTYSLIHDDLPCMDDAELRRGKPANHNMFGEATAVLAGDALLTAAFETMLDPDYTRGVNLAKVNRAAYVIAWNSGVYGMAGGQQLDMESEFLEQSVLEAGYLQSLKTGALISAAAEAGCILGNGNEIQYSYAQSYAHALGLAFQIRDDILNIEGNEQELGKNIGTDAGMRKLTFIRVLGVEKCKELMQTITDDAIGFLEPFENTEFLTWLARGLVTRKS